jgi:non-specific serine/threonine protein kinase
MGGRIVGRFTNLGAAERYDVTRGRWARLPDIPTPRGGLAAAATENGLVVTAGGEAPAPVALEEVEAFDVTAGRWLSLPPLPHPRHGLGVVAVGSTVYVIDGGPRPGGNTSSINEAIDLSGVA